MWRWNKTSWLQLLFCRYSKIIAIFNNKLMNISYYNMYNIILETIKIDFCLQLYVLLVTVLRFAQSFCSSFDRTSQQDVNYLCYPIPRSFHFCFHWMENYSRNFLYVKYESKIAYSLCAIHFSISWYLKSASILVISLLLSLNWTQGPSSAPQWWFSSYETFYMKLKASTSWSKL